MSSDRSKRQDRFRLTAAVTIGALLLAAVGLTVANTLQGPRLLDAQINAGAAVEGAGERLVLRVDQTVAELTADQVTVRPTVPVEPTSDGAALILRFADSLSYATTYEIVAKVRKRDDRRVLHPEVFVPDSGRRLLHLAARRIERRHRRARPNRPPFHRIDRTAGCAQPAAHRAVRRRRSCDRGRDIRCRRCRYVHCWPTRRIRANPDARRQFRHQPTEIVGAERPSGICPDPVERPRPRWRWSASPLRSSGSQVDHGVRIRR